MDKKMVRIDFKEMADYRSCEWRERYDNAGNSKEVKYIFSPEVYEEFLRVTKAKQEGTSGFQGIDEDHMVKISAFDNKPFAPTIRHEIIKPYQPSPRPVNADFYRVVKVDRKGILAEQIESIEKYEAWRKANVLEYEKSTSIEDRLHNIEEALRKMIDNTEFSQPTMWGLLGGEKTFCN